MNNGENSNKMKLGMFRTEHLLIVQTNDPDKFIILCIPKKYMKKKNLGVEELKEIFKRKNGEIRMCPDGIRFIIDSVRLYYDEAIEGFRKKAKEKGFDVFLEIN